MERETIKQQINQLKEEKNAIILAHNYQIGEIQDIADITGDSLELARKAAETDKDMIVFCGVYFMAETAKILSPQKTVLIPEKQAGCEMAKMISGEDIQKLREQYPDAIFVAYINTTAEVKANIDICVTSSNALDVVKKLPKDKEIVFVPDKNLGYYVKKNVSDRKIILVDGYCYVHNDLTGKMLEEKKSIYPGYPIIAHPESSKAVIEGADMVTSTSGMLRYIRENQIKKAIIGTEIGIIHQFLKLFPDGEYIPLSEEAICKDMKKITLETLHASLKNNQYQVELEQSTIDKAKLSINRMLKGKL